MNEWRQRALREVVDWAKDVAEAAELMAGGEDDPTTHPSQWAGALASLQGLVLGLVQAWLDCLQLEEATGRPGQRRAPGAEGGGSRGRV